MILKKTTHSLQKSPDKIGAYLLCEMGIMADVVLINDRPAIRVSNHFSLFSIINKIRKDFDFEVYHNKGNDNYIIYLND